MKVLIITEKPRVAERIAKILSDGKIKKINFGKVATYRFTLNNNECYVVPASGHVVELDFPGKEWFYPIIMEPNELVYRRIRGKGKYLRAIKEVGSDADLIVIATDLDTEGSAIALEILRVMGWDGKKDVKRMEFSALTPKEIKKAFQDLKPFDKPRALAGFSRQVVDLEWGANVTRALTISTRKHTGVKVLSGGRVQSPTLSILVDREREIRNFVPETYYSVIGIFEHEAGNFEARALPPPGKERIDSQEYAQKIKEDCEGKEGLASVRSRETLVRPPAPFNGTSMQVDVSSITGLSPKALADRRRGIAQQLYEAGYISYIGTESEKYPKEWSRKDFIQMVKIIRSYPPLRKEAEWVLANMREKPVEGKKEDPAHPCIHITGAPKSPEDFPTKKHRQVYEVIARRVLATLSPDGKDLRTRIDIDVEGHPFRATGKAILERGWREVYPYLADKEVLLPPVQDGDSLLCLEVKIEERQTQPPKRYTPRSLIKKMEKLGLGTKNTRAQILDILRERGYVEGRSFVVTPLGEVVVDVLRKHVPEIVDPEFTAQLDKAMRSIELGELDHSKFINSSLDMLKKIMWEFKKNEEEIGKEIAEGLKKHRMRARLVGKCLACGGELVIKRGRYGRFVACTSYPNCSVTFNLFSREEILDQLCSCGLPLVSGSIKTKSGRSLKYMRCLGNCKESPLRCRECGSVALVRSGRFGTYIQCSSCPKTNYFTVRRS